MITGEQVKAARKLLKWSQEGLWLEAGVGPTTLKNFETGQSRPSVLSVTTIQRALEAAGVEFTNGGKSGVRLKEKPPTIAGKGFERVE
jgi:transcriptional regulator with XRE-family HTH domain